MEYILNKNIFDDNDLTKLAPDYSSTRIMLRMQTRRSLSKDTHTHGVTKSHSPHAWHRKPIKRLKDDYKINHEIVKIRNSFNYANLRNRIMVKNAIKYVDNTNSRSFIHLGDLYQEIKNETDPLLVEFFDDNTELVVHNESDFKIKEKSNSELPTDAVTEEKKTIESESVETYIEETNENVLRIECRLHKLMESDFNETELANDGEEEINEQGEIDEDLHPRDNKLDRQVDNLESLLTMMTLSTCTEMKSKYFEELTGDNRDADGRLDVHHTNGDEVIIQEKGNVISTENDITDVLSVTPIRVKINDKQMIMMQKYVTKWRDYVYRKKDYMAKKRQQTLNNFFEKLAMKKKMISNELEPGNKAKLLAKDGMYQHRYKVQKHIIALQKAKLEEQKRIIEELKYKKIVEASQQSMDSLREEVRKTYHEIDRNLKPKVKCLGNDLKIHIEEPSLVLHCLKVPQFLQRMEKRAREREEKHAIIRERRRQMEEERLRLKQQAELAKAEMDKEEKMKIIKELREKRKREKIENIRKKQYAERMRALNVMADLHYEKYLKMKYGINPLRALLEIKRDNIEKAKSHHTFLLKKNMFLHWMWHAEDMWFERNFKAEDFHRKKVLKKAFDALKKNTQELVLKKQVAEDYYDLYVTRLTFRKLREGITVMRKELQEKWESAVRYYECDLLFKTFTCWRALPALNAITREQEARKAKWRQKVLQVVPDYTPPDD